MRDCRILTFFVSIWPLIGGVALAAETNANPVATIAWEKDYIHAMDLANQQHKMLLIFFSAPNDTQSRRLEAETFGNAEVMAKQGGFVSLRLTMDAKVTAEGKDFVLLQHPTLREMLGRPGIAIADFAHDDEHLHGRIVSCFPLCGSLWYGPAEMKVILDLPPGTITQRT